MAGESLPFYHYGSYMVASLAADLGDLPALQVATSLYPVLGMLLTGSAMLALANATAGPAIALLAVMILYFVPDPSCCIPGNNRWHSYFFFQQVGVGGAYAVAVLGLALAYALRAIQRGSMSRSLVGLMTFAIAGLFKIQILVAYSLPHALFVLWNEPWRSRIARPLAVGLAVTAFYFAIASMDRVPGAPTLRLNTANIGAVFAEAAASLPTLFAHVPHAMLWLLLPLVLIGLLALTYGLLFPLLAYLAWRQRHAPSARHVLELLLITVSTQVFLRLVVADDQGAGYFAEINRKTVVWPYFVVVYCTSVLLAHEVAQRQLAWNRRRRWLLGLLTGTLIALSAVFARDLQTFSGLSDTHTKTTIPAGLFASAMFVRANADPAEVVQLCENDQLNVFGALSERPVFVAKIITYGFPYTARERERFETIDRVLREEAPEIAFRLLGNAGISWFLMSPACRASWEAEHAPAFEHSGYRLYRLPPSSPPTR
jgi:hypothetical protein